MGEKEGEKRRKEAGVREEGGRERKRVKRVHCTYLYILTCNMKSEDARTLYKHTTPTHPTLLPCLGHKEVWVVQFCLLLCMSLKNERSTSGRVCMYTIVFHSYGLRI